MTKHESSFVGEVVVNGVELPPVKTRSQRLAAWRKENKTAYQKACDDHCTCTPTRAQMLLIDQWDAGPSDL